MQATLEQGNWQKPWGMLVAKAWSDDDLKQRLVADPAAVLAEHGVDVPPGVELVLPPSPAGDLIVEELTSSTGFYCYSGVCGACGRCGCGCGRCGCFDTSGVDS